MNLTEAQPGYFIDATQPFPKRWKDHIGNITVMAGPVKGWLMVRRPGAVPFCLSVDEMLNAKRHPVHGPFTLAQPAGRAALQEGQK